MAATVVVVSPSAYAEVIDNIINMAPTPRAKVILLNSPVSAAYIRSISIC